MNLLRTILGAGVLVLFALPASAERVRPFDEGPRDRSLTVFRDGLIAALLRKDVKYVVARAAPGIRLGFGGRNGRKWFRKNLLGTHGPRNARAKAGAAEYRSWLRWVLMNGGGFVDRGKGFVAPYQNAYEARVPSCTKKPAPKSRVCQIDPFARAYVLGRGVSIYACPSSQSKVIAKLSYTLIELGKHIRRKTRDGRNVRLWSEVKLEDGRRGYIRPIHYYSTVGYRARFAKHKGRWRIDYFLAGD